MDVDDELDGKLVRDLVPDVIRRRGRVPVVRTATGDEFRERLRIKLLEEAGEFLDAREEEAGDELADILEVVYALADQIGLTREDLEQRRADKEARVGGFSRRLVWFRNEA